VKGRSRRLQSGWEKMSACTALVCAASVCMPRSQPTDGAVGDTEYMRIAIDLAGQGAATTAPNPPVGAVVVQDGSIVGRGWHQLAGSAHAEIMALADAGAAARDGTLYVTLEPCNHTGRTGPCTRAILEAGVRRVVIGTRDPNPDVDGDGATFLRSNGVEVIEGVLRDDADHLIRAFRHHVITGRPWVLAKMAMSLDGKVATQAGHSQWITSSASREHAHRIRGSVHALLVGVQTVIDDDPSLTARVGDEIVHEPIRVILDSQLRIPLAARVVRPGTFILTTAAGESASVAALERAGCRVLRCDADSAGRVDVPSALNVLGAAGIQMLLVEGGPSVLGSFFDSRLVQEIHAYLAPVVIGGAGARNAIDGLGIGELSEAFRLEPVVTHCGPDILISGLVQS